MGTNGGDHLLQLLYGRHDLRADHGVQLHLLVLVGSEHAVFAEDTILDADLTDIVEQGADPDLVLRLFGKLQVAGDGATVGRNPLGMAARIGIFGVDRGHDGA